MNRLQSFKFELMPSGQQQRAMCRFAGVCRYVFNKALSVQIARYEQGEKHLSYAALCKKLTEWRACSDTPWLAQAHSQILQQSLKDLDRAYTNFFAARAGFPNFRRKGQRDCFRFPQGCKLDQNNRRLFLPKIGYLRYRHSRDVQGEVKNVTVSRHGRKWFVAIQTEREVEPPLPSVTTAIGIDVGIARFATMSDGSFIAPLGSFKKHQQRLARYQRRMSRKARRPQSSSARTGSRRKPKSGRFTIVSPISEKTSCTKPAQRSGSPPAPTTRSSVLRTCRYAICPGQQKAARNCMGKWFGKSPA